jgi:putative membrane protein
MKTLVLCVDRDDDVGTKTSLKGPLIGRDENLDAATRLGLADPEDSDVNTILTAIAVYDDQSKLGEDTEVATITGDVRVGPISDRILTQQLEQVLEEVKPDRAFLVSDGAEDEYIFPVISSRIRVDHVRRVYVRQSPAIESTYYTIVRAMRNPKIRRKIVFPVGLALVVFSAIFLYSPVLAPAIVGLAIGLYFLVISLPFASLADVVKKAGEYYESIRTRFATRDFSLMFNIVSLIIVLVGVSLAINVATRPEQAGPVNQIVVLSAFIAAVLTYESGKVVTAYLQKGKAPKHTWIVAGSLIAVGLLLFGLWQVLQPILGLQELSATLPLTLASIGGAILIVIAAVLSFREREERAPEDGWRH